MGDFGPDGHLGMVCVETGNALENVVSIPPGGEHVMNCVVSVEALS
jgi:D-hexose-6-phosphate mutarotase